ncbi:MAG: K(+)-transporting ATPase subunit F [Oligoflexia bacterium]|nr:K(+)-transporting ATPase subunit F [Oligoflexia bacterium]
MNDYFWCGLIVIGLLVYLFWGLLYPEKF